MDTHSHVFVVETLDPATLAHREVARYPTFWAAIAHHPHMTLLSAERDSDDPDYWNVAVGARGAGIELFVIRREVRAS